MHSDAYGTGSMLLWCSQLVSQAASIWEKNQIQDISLFVNSGVSVFKLLRR
jgi:hypothetical protein